MKTIHYAGPATFLDGTRRSGLFPACNGTGHARLVISKDPAVVTCKKCLQAMSKRAAHEAACAKPVLS